MHRKFTSLLFLFLATGLMAQTLEKRIPAQTSFVLCLNLHSLSQKINFNDLGNYSFLKKPDNAEVIDPSTAIKELFRLPEKAGINRNDKIFIFSENHDSIENLNYLIALSDVKLFQQRIIDILKTPGNKPEFKKEGKMKVLNHNHKMSIGVGKDYALISTWTSVYYYSDDYYEYNEERNKVVAMIDSIRYSKMEVDTTGVYEPDVETAPVEEPEPPDTLSHAEPEEMAAPDTVVEVVETVYQPEPPYENSYDNDSLMKQFERKWAAIRKQKEEKFYATHDRKMSLRQKAIYGIKPGESIAANADFAKVFANTSDIIYWFNYKSYSPQLIKVMSEKPYRSQYDTAYYRLKMQNPPPNKLAELMENNTMYALGNFNQGELKMNFYNSFNDLLKPFIEKVYSNQINPEFFKYIKSDDLMGLVGFSINAEAAANLYYEIFRRALESTATPNPYFLTAVEMTDLFLDKKVLYHTLRGDAVLAFTGIKSYLKTFTSYKYDTLTFESQPYEETTTKYVPEFVSVMTIENRENLDRILKMILRLDGIVEVMKDVYAFKARDKDIDGQFFLAIKDNLFFITNDKALATEQLKAGMGSDRVVGDAYSSYLNNTSFGLWDASKMFKLMAERPDEKFGKPDMFYKLSDKVNKGFFITRPMEGNLANSEITIEMKNRENSSLLEILKLFDDIYLLNKYK